MCDEVCLVGCITHVEYDLILLVVLLLEIIVDGSEDLFINAFKVIYILDQLDDVQLPLIVIIDHIDAHSINNHGRLLSHTEEVLFVQYTNCAIVVCLDGGGSHATVDESDLTKVIALGQLLDVLLLLG